MTVQISPIAESDLPRVARFFADNMESEISDWDVALAAPWSVDAPNRGFMLLAEDTVVGAYVAYYSEQTVDGNRERFCNLGTWCVLPKWRMHSIGMLKAILAQEGYHFTDLTPSEPVVALNSKLGFKPLETRSAVIPPLPWPSAPGISVTSDPDRIREVMSTRDLIPFRDHADAAGVLHALVEDDRGYCYAALRKERRRGLPVAVLIHVSDPDGFRRRASHLVRHLLSRHRVTALIVEDRLVADMPRPKLRLGLSQTRMFRSDRLRPGDIGYLYSELACLPN